ncbi:MAG TPA: chlorite dismutase family protein [Candidatus Dormibacteraeota bacterium]|nr:chlorite dismutase family protein [Candidatus Dormibacteraeota bacterium]
MIQDTERLFVQALALGLDPAWRRRPERERAEDAAELIRAVERGRDGVITFTYSMIGLHPGAELLLWRQAGSLDLLEEAAADVLRAGAGRSLHAVHSLLGIIQPSQYVKRPTEQEQSLFTGERSRYLVVYPFTKSTEWYLLGQSARQGIMNEHMRVGHEYPQIRQLLAYSFGIDDQDFLVAYETDDLVSFGNLVRDLRGTESRRSTVRDTPILTCVHRPLVEIMSLLGAEVSAGVSA